MDILKNTVYDNNDDDRMRRRIECLTALQVIQCSVFLSVHYYNDHYRLIVAVLKPTQKVH